MTRFHALSPTAQGVLLAILSVFCFSLLDLSAKALTLQVGTVQTLWARYLGQTALVTLLVLPRLRSTLKTDVPGLHFLRSCLQLGATALFFTGLRHIGLAEATAVMEIAPVLITLGAALFLRERFGPRRAAGVGVALIGALIIIRPGTAVFSPYSLLPLGAALCYSGYALVTRRVGATENVWTSLLLTGLVGSAVLSAMVPFTWVSPEAQGWVLLGLVGVLGMLGQLCLIAALMRAEANQVAPLAYLGLLFATLWGLIFFGTVPDAATILGGLVIVGAGIYVWHRETRARRA